MDPHLREATDETGSTDLCWTSCVELSCYARGRFTITPDFPSGTYAYFATIDATGAGAYPYLVGPTYYGMAAQDDLTHSVTIPANATLYVVPEPAGAAAIGLMMLGLRRRGRGRGRSPHLRRA